MPVRPGLAKLVLKLGPYLCLLSLTGSRRYTFWGHLGDWVPQKNKVCLLGTCGMYWVCCWDSQPGASVLKSQLLLSSGLLQATTEVSEKDVCLRDGDTGAGAQVEPSNAFI